MPFLKRLLSCGLKSSNPSKDALQEEKRRGKRKLDEADSDDFGPHPTDIAQEKGYSVSIPRNTTPPPLSSIPAGPSKSMPPRVTPPEEKTEPSYSMGGSYRGTMGLGTMGWRPYAPTAPMSGGDYPTHHHGSYWDSDRDGGGDYDGGDFGGGDSGAGGGDGGGCVLGSCLVSMADGTTKPVSELVKGDTVLATPFGDGPSEPTAAEVSCLIYFKLPAGKKNMVRLPYSGLVISPTHPILVPTSTSSTSDSDDTPPPTWIYPSSLANPLTIPCDRVYNILLSSSAEAKRMTITIGGMQVSTLGQDAMRGGWMSFSGDYEKVVRELRRVDGAGLDRGVVELGGMRRGAKGRVCGFFGVRDNSWDRIKGTPALVAPAA
jgi:hypothetical protein